MARKAPKVRVRKRGKQKDFSVNWDVVRADYVTGEGSLRDIARVHKLPERTVFHRSKTEGWVALRDEFRSQLAADLQQRRSEDELTYRLSAAKTIRGIKERALSNLRDLVEQGVTLSVRDLDILQRLEMDLQEPGWDKAEGEKQPGTTNVFVGLETTVMEALKERGTVVDVDATVKSLDGDKKGDGGKGLDGQVSRFLYGDGEDASEG